MHAEFNQNIFHLYNDKISYMIGILSNGHLGHLYYGKRLYGEFDLGAFRVNQDRPLTAYVEKNLSLGLERLEYPNYGTSDFREPAIDLIFESGSHIVDFKYKSHRIYKGKEPINLPHTFDADLTLEIKLEDKKGLELLLSYSMFKGLDAISKHVRLTNYSDESIRINRLLSTSIDLPDRNFEFMQFSGDWARERHIYKTPLNPGIHSVYSKRGASSAHHNPSALLVRPETTEFSGEAFGMALIYSGNFLAQAEVDANDILRFQCGIHPDYFQWTLDSGQSFQAPEAILTYSSEGLNYLSHQFHNLFNKHLINKKWQNSQKPVLINNWEATYFDFDEEKLVSLASEAYKLGIELFVLDDGWFGLRNDDTTGLGDWFVNRDKLKNGVKGVRDKIKDMGMKFGIWIEPEMANLETKLLSEHPDFLIGDPTRDRSPGRNQYVLDYSRKEVVDHIYNQLIQVLDDCPVDYIKWDMNRNITEAYSVFLEKNRQGELFHRYILGVYDLYERLTSRYQDTLFESCASGGGRFDPALLYYAPQAWTSDNTDAVERLKIQYGTSMIYPIQSMGSHVSEVPNHQNRRMTSLEMRTHVAYFGTFGYELDITKLSEDEKNQIKADTAFFKKHRKLIHQGDFFRLMSPFDNNDSGWMVMKGKEVLACWYRVLAQSNPGPTRFKLKGLKERGKYKLNDRVFTGSYLMNHGILLKQAFTGIECSGDPSGDFQSRLFYLEEV